MKKNNWNRFISKHFILRDVPTANAVILLAQIEKGRILPCLCVKIGETHETLH